MKKTLSLIAFSVLLLSCHKEKSNVEIQDIQSTEISYIQSDGNTIIERFIPEDGFKRIDYEYGDFGYFLQHLPLKPDGENVLYYNGEEKQNHSVYQAVIDLPIGTKDLHQCADAAMRLRADYLYQQKRYNEIAFNFLSDGKPRYYTEFVEGDYSENKYWSYLEYIFSYANTVSLKDQLRTISYQEVKIGDILIQKGNPYGHAVMVVDLITDGTNQKVVLAQSYMPAQELQILMNPNKSNGSPWYDLKDGEIKTPEWNFTSNDWKTWK